MSVLPNRQSGEELGIAMRTGMFVLKATATINNRVRMYITNDLGCFDLTDRVLIIHAFLKVTRKMESSIAF